MIVSASKRRLLNQCRYPFRSDVISPEPSTLTKNQSIGINVHNAIYSWLSAGVTGPIDSIGARMFMSWAQWFVQWEKENPVSWKRPEQAMQLCIDPITCHFIEVSSHRDYPKTPARSYAYGTADLVAMSSYGSMVHVLDWKTYTKKRYDTLEKSLPQIKMLGSMAQIATGADRFKVWVVEVGRDVTDASCILFDEIDARADAMELRGLIQDVSTSSPAVGSECKWCPLKGICPAWLS